MCKKLKKKQTPGKFYGKFDDYVLTGKYIGNPNNTMINFKTNDDRINLKIRVFNNEPDKDISEAKKKCDDKTFSMDKVYNPPPPKTETNSNTETNSSNIETNSSNIETNSSNSDNKIEGGRTKRRRIRRKHTRKNRVRK
jgi:hypothetical protein